MISEHLDSYPHFTWRVFVNKVEQQWNASSKF